MFMSAFVCGIASAIYLFTRRRAADRVAVAAAELTVMSRDHRAHHRDLCGRARPGASGGSGTRGSPPALVLWLIFIAYLLLRRYGGPGSDRLGAGVAIFGMANVPFVYWSVNVWRTVHPKTSVVPTLQPGMRGPFWFCVAAFLALYVLVLLTRAALEERRDALEALYLATEDGVDHA